MPDLTSLLDDLAERGEARGATEILRRAASELGPPRSVRPPQRRRRLVLIIGAVAVVGIVSVAVVVRDEDDDARVTTAAPASSEEAMREGDMGGVIWAGRGGVVIGDPQTGAQEILVPDEAASCGGVLVGDFVFTGQPGLRIDTRDLSVERVGAGGCVFADANDEALYAVLSVETSVTGTATEIQRVDLDGRLLAGPWTVPAGNVLTSPPRAVVGGVLIETDENSNNHTLSVWNPDTGEVTSVGPARWVIDTFTRRGDNSSLVAYVAAGCDTTGCGVMVTEVPDGRSIRVEPPAGSPSYFGGGAFSPDGAQLAVFASHPPPENIDPAVDLAIVDVASGAVTGIAGSAVSVGEPYGFATWTPDGHWLYFGGLSDRLKAHFRGTPDAVELALPSDYTTVAVPGGRQGWRATAPSNPRDAPIARTSGTLSAGIM